MGRYAALSILLAVLAYNVPAPGRYLVVIASVVVVVLSTIRWWRIRNQGLR